MRKPVESCGYYWLDGNGNKERMTAKQAKARLHKQHVRDGVGDLVIDVVDRGDRYHLFSYYPMRKM